MTGVETFTLVIEHGAETERHALPAAQPVLIGRSLIHGNDIALPDPTISKRQVRLSYQGDHFVLTEGGSTEGFRLDGEVVGAVTPGRGWRPQSRKLAPLQPFGLGVYVAWIELAPQPEPSALECALRVRYEIGEPGASTVYADWLEEQGRHAHAAFVRLDHERDPTELRRLRVTAGAVPKLWRHRYARVPIEAGCADPHRALTWSALRGRGNDLLRWCNCGSPVVFCATVPIARDQLRQGYHVALDPTLDRKFGDLGPRVVALRRVGDPERCMPVDE